MAPLKDERVAIPLGKQQVWRGGAGAPVVYLHSATGEPAMAPAFLEELAETFEVYAPMFPGFGESEGIEAIDGPEDAAFYLADLLRALDLERPHLIGTSLGGWLAAELAVRWPERLGRIVLVNPVGLHIPGAPIKEIFGRDPAELAEDLFADQSHPLAAAMRQMSELAHQKVQIPFELVRPVLQSLAATARIGWNPYLHNPKLPGRLHRITNAVLLVRAAMDRLVPAAHVARYAELLPNAQVIEVPDAGHLVPLERPGELAAIVRDFLAS
ncbi:MAG: alpha/beta hydrolase [Acidimicrobiia bacterium]